MTSEEWDTHWYRIRDSLMGDGYSEASVMADLEAVDQFGPRPTERRH